ncbi:kinase-like domain-containing protein [Xylariaceae sp. FL1651]|nr:kinase-like domain-containing protein [Xylariaceae sp. FL1651]
MAAHREPQNWQEQYRADMWRFEEYRTAGGVLGHLTASEYGRIRTRWLGRLLPRPGQRRLRGERIGAWIREEIQRSEGGVPPLAGVTPDGYKHDSIFHQAKKRLQDVQEYFSDDANFAFMKTLGFGGMGLALKYQCKGVAPPLTFVVKVGLRGWESADLRSEEKYTKKVARAAHCIQMIPREKIGLPPQQQWRFDVPEVDDSSSEGESSGDESRDDEPGPAVTRRKSRREIMRDDPDAMTRKEQKYQARVHNALARQEERKRRKYRMRTRSTENNDGWDLDRKDFLLIEFCENGDLENLLFRLAEEDETVPNRVLWAFWLCLVRACVAMQYPPRKFHPRRRQPPPALVNAQPGVDIQEAGKVVGEDLFEEIPIAKRRWAAKRTVHFDIDPKNIFITGFDVNAKDNEHKLVPRLKLADFGLAEDIKPNKRNMYYSRRRASGKWGYYAPEQFGVDWEYIRQDDGTLIEEDGPEISEQVVAGQYGAPMNVWGMALTMWQLITHYHPPVPPPLQPVTQPLAHIPNNYCALLLKGTRYDRVDIELRETIARCMAHDPRDRPPLRTLLAEAKRGINKVFPNETDDFIKKWVDRMFFTVPDISDLSLESPI